MNLWECQHQHCGNKAVGIGGAIGLRAIGWFFEKGTTSPLTFGTIYCPNHHPKVSKDCSEDKKCSVCKNVDKIQKSLLTSKG